MDLLLLNYLVSQSGDTQHFTDQSSFNFIIHNNLVKNSIKITGLESNWALQIGTLLNPNLIGDNKINIKNNKIIAKEAIGYAMPDNETYQSFLINNDLTIDVYDVNYNSRSKKILERHQIKHDGSIVKIK